MANIDDGSDKPINIQSDQNSPTIGTNPQGVHGPGEVSAEEKHVVNDKKGSTYSEDDVDINGERALPKDRPDQTGRNDPKPHSGDQPIEGQTPNDDAVRTDKDFEGENIRKN